MHHIPIWRKQGSLNTRPVLPRSSNSPTACFMDIRLLVPPPSPEHNFRGYRAPLPSISTIQLPRPPDPILSPTRFTPKRKDPNQIAVQRPITKRKRTAKPAPVVHDHETHQDSPPPTDAELASDLQDSSHNTIGGLPPPLIDDAVPHPEPFQIYVDAVFRHVAGFFQISCDIFVVQGWNFTAGASTVSTLLISFFPFLYFSL